MLDIEPHRMVFKVRPETQDSTAMFEHPRSRDLACAKNLACGPVAIALSQSRKSSLNESLNMAALMKVTVAVMYLLVHVLVGHAD